MPCLVRRITGRVWCPRQLLVGLFRWGYRVLNQIFTLFEHPYTHADTCTLYTYVQCMLWEISIRVEKYSTTSNILTYELWVIGTSCITRFWVIFTLFILILRFKGKVSQDEYFLMGVLKIKSTLFCMSTDGFHNTVFSFLFVEKIKNKVSACPFHP